MPEPPHRQIENQRPAPEPVPGKAFDPDPGQSGQPDRREDRNAERTAHGQQHDRRVGPGDQQVDRGMVEPAQQRLAFRSPRRMVAARSEVHAEKRRQVDGKNGDPPGTALRHDERHKRHAAQRENRAGGMGQDIQPLLARRIIAAPAAHSGSLIGKKRMPSASVSGPVSTNPQCR